MSHERLVELFNDSFERTITRMPAQFFDGFYERFLSSSIEVAELFSNTNMSRQKGMLEDSLAYLTHFAATGTSTKSMERLARLHGSDGLGIKPEQYDHWLTVLMATVREIDPKTTEDTEAAWRYILSKGIKFMITSGRARSPSET